MKKGTWFIAPQSEETTKALPPCTEFASFDKRGHLQDPIPMVAIDEDLLRSFEKWRVAGRLHFDTYFRENDSAPIKWEDFAAYLRELATKNTVSDPRVRDPFRSGRRRRTSVRLPYHRSIAA
jgi:hypothetical protein